jgi:signal peptidase II
MWSDRRLRAYGAAAAVFAADRATKWFVESRVSFADTYRVIPGFFDIVHSQNRGVAFGLFNDSASGWRTMLLVVLAVAAVALVSALLWNSGRMERGSFWGFALILGGAAGNVFDRIVWGRVTDFLEFYIGAYHWPTFNVADTAIVIGCGLLLLDALRPKRQAEHVS